MKTDYFPLGHFLPGSPIRRSRYKLSLFNQLQSNVVCNIGRVTCKARECLALSTDGLAVL